jgi:hypothetical protein
MSSELETRFLAFGFARHNAQRRAHDRSIDPAHDRSTWFFDQQSLANNELNTTLEEPHARETSARCLSRFLRGERIELETIDVNFSRDASICSLRHVTWLLLCLLRPIYLLKEE